MANFLQLIMQVGSQYDQCSYRSDCRILVIVPCPQKCRAILSDCWNVFMLLLLSGDIESNPGPTEIEVTLQMILDNQSNMTKQLQEVKAGQDSLRQEMTGINAKIAGFKTALANIEKEMAQVASLKKSVAILERTVRQQNDRLIDLENRSRRNNLLIFGLPEKDNEST
ncbi:unnamed protein product [Ixodes persulcatus]